MPEIVVGTDRLHFFDEGEGPTVLMVHGSCGGAGQWKSLSAGLRDAGYRTVRVDLLGCGSSSPWPIERAWRQGSDTEGLEALLDHVGAPVHLVLHSGGGTFCFPLIKQRQRDLLSLTMFEPTFFTLLHELQDPLFGEPKALADGYRARWDEGSPENAMAFFIDGWARREGVWAALPEPMKDMMRTGSARLYHEWGAVPMPFPHRADLRELQVPTLLFKGTETIASVHALMAIAVREIPGARLVEIEGAGHVAPFTHAQVALPHVAEHLQSVSR